MIEFEKLSALADGQLEPSEQRVIEAQLAEDPRAAEQLATIKLTRDALQTHLAPVDCKNSWKACVKRLDELDRVKNTRSFVDRYAWAMCTVLFVFILSVGMYNRSNPGVRAATGDLTRASLGNPISDARRAFDWIRDKFGKAPTIPTQTLEVVDGSEGVFAGRPVARIHLRDAKGDLGLMVVPGTVTVEGVSPMGDGQHFSGREGESTCVAWADRGLVMVLVADRDANELKDIANTIHVGQ